MIANQSSFEPHSSDPLPNSKRVYVQGKIHPDVQVPMREISLAPTQSFQGRVETNEPVRAYDCSGPWGDPGFRGDVARGLPRVREPWIRARGDVQEYEGRAVQPMDNGYLSAQHAEYASRAERNRLQEFPGLRHPPLRSASRQPVTQLAYARRGIITPEMEFIAIRENQGLAEWRSSEADVRNSGHHRHA